MIIGLTKIQKKQKLEALYEWRPYYSLFPTKLDDGRWVWLQTIERRLDAWVVENLGFKTYRYRLKLP